MYTRSGCALLYLRNEHSVVKQLYSDKKKNEKNHWGLSPNIYGVPTTCQTLKQVQNLDKLMVDETKNECVTMKGHKVACVKGILTPSFDLLFPGFFSH